MYSVFMHLRFGVVWFSEVLGRAEEHPGSAPSTQFGFSTPGQVVNKGVVILPEQVLSESLTKVGSQPVKLQEEIFPLQTTNRSVNESESQSKESQGVIVLAQIPKGRVSFYNVFAYSRLPYDIWKNHLCFILCCET